MHHIQAKITNRKIDQNAKIYKIVYMKSEKKSLLSLALPSNYISFPAANIQGIIRNCRNVNPVIR